MSILLTTPYVFLNQKFDNTSTVHFQTQVKPDVKNIIDVIENVKKKFKDEDLDITCGYEAGCLGLII